MKKYNLKIEGRDADFPSVKITSSEVCAAFARNFYHDDIEIYESFFLVLCNLGLTTTGYVKISQGGIAGTVVDVKIIAKYVIDTLSERVVLVHNHPSGTLKPSNADLNITRKIKEGLNMFDCKVVDHIILTKDGYYSFSDEGIL